MDAANNTSIVSVFIQAGRPLCIKCYRRIFKRGNNNFLTVTNLKDYTLSSSTIKFRDYVLPRLPKSITGEDKANLIQNIKALLLSSILSYGSA
jgi:hypothetical protein